MKIIKAMKKIKRLQGEIKDVKARIQSSVRTLEENDYEEFYSDLSQDLKEKTVELICLKTAVMHTNVKHNMFQTILELGELKGCIEYLKELDTQKGTEIYNYGNISQKYKTQLTTSDKRKLIKTCQKEINDLIDKLDEFNNKTDVEEIEVTVQPLP